MRLYDSANTHGRSKRIELTAVAAEFGETDLMKVYNAGKTLESRGLIYASFRDGGNIYAGITGDGELFIERGGTTGVIADFRHDLQRDMVSIDQSTHFHGTVSHNNIATHSQVGTQSLSLPREQAEIIDRIAEMIQTDLSFADEQRRELLGDVRTLRDELQRQKPRGGLVRALLSTLSDVSSIAGLVIELQLLLPKF